MPKIVQATSSQAGNIARFLEHAPLVHRHLDWTPLFDWIETPPFLQYVEGDHLSGILACPQDPEKVSWLKCFACNLPQKAALIFNALIYESCNILSQQVDSIYSLGFHDWFINILHQSGFQKFQDVIVLAYNNHYLRSRQIKKVFTRPMELSDIDSVVRVDHLSFEPIWTISPKGLEAAFLQSAHASVAEIDDKIVGYELSTANDFSAHLARVAILPEHQHAQIGHQLVEEMITHFARKGINAITVNTQSTNKASINLYRKTGFIETGERFPVYRKSVLQENTYNFP